VFSSVLFSRSFFFFFFFFLKKCQKKRFTVKARSSS